MKFSTTEQSGIGHDVLQLKMVNIYVEQKTA